VEHFLNNWVSISFSRRTLSHGVGMAPCRHTCNRVCLRRRKLLNRVCKYMVSF